MSVFARYSFGGNLYLISSIFHCSNGVSILLNGRKLSLIHRIKGETFLLFWVELSRYILCIICLYFFKRPVRVNHNENRQTNGSKTRQAHNIFLPNFQNILVGPIGVYWSLKNGCGVHSKLGSQ